MHIYRIDQIIRKHFLQTVLVLYIGVIEPMQKYGNPAVSTQAFS